MAKGFNPYLHRSADKEKQSVAYWRSFKQEEIVAKRLGAKKTRGSGSGKKKGDLYIDSVARIECKTTQRNSFSVTQDMLDKITNAAIGCDEIPAIVVEFIDGAGKRKNEVAVIPMWAFEVLIEKAKAK